MTGKTERRDKGSVIQFAKMHGAGNDYIYVNGFEQSIDDPEVLAREVSDVHFGIGADGLVIILPSERADFRMRMFNADGSEAEMCGNATRCVGKYVYEMGLTASDCITLDTLGGIKTLHLHINNGVVESVTVDMGQPILRPSEIPVASRDPKIKIAEREIINNKEYIITGISMGNPHAVIFVDEITDEQVLAEGPVLECADIFPRKANIEFAKILDRNNIAMRVWERGTGETWACGTGACATAVAAMLNGLTDRTVTLHLRGGDLQIEWDKETDRVNMTGPAEWVCEGIFYRNKI